MTLIGRFFIVCFALLIAILVSGIALAVGILAPDWTGIDSDPVERFTFFALAFFATGFVVTVALLPAFAMIALAEALRIRNFLYYAVAGALIGLFAYFGSDVSSRLENTTDITPVGHVLQLAAAAGIIGGLVYWLLAGRRAGLWREPRPLP